MLGGSERSLRPRVRGSFGDGLESARTRRWEIVKSSKINGERSDVVGKECGLYYYRMLECCDYYLDRTGRERRTPRLS